MAARIAQLVVLKAAPSFVNDRDFSATARNHGPGEWPPIFRPYRGRQSLGSIR